MKNGNFKLCAPTDNLARNSRRDKLLPPLARGVPGGSRCASPDSQLLIVGSSMVFYHRRWYINAVTNHETQRACGCNGTTHSDPADGKRFFEPQINSDSHR